jgi:hypothetical protein
LATPAKSLLVLLDEVNKQHPGRDKSSDGWLGDTRHSESGRPENGGSKHNPNRRGVVCARDFDNSALNVARFVACAMKHPSTRNIIYNRKIRSKGYSGGLAKVYAYHGVNAHDKHVHVDIEMTVAAENSTRAWGYYTGKPVVTVPVVAKPGVPVPKGGMTRMPTLQRTNTVLAATRTLQRALNVLGYKAGAVDGKFGSGTQSAVKTFQHRAQLSSDGLVGPKTWCAIAQALVRRAVGTPAKANGVFDAGTAAAVIKFQKARKMTADGIIGPVTWTALLK